MDNSKKSKNVYKEEIRGYLSEDEYPLFCRRGMERGSVCGAWNGEGVGNVCGGWNGEAVGMFVGFVLEWVSGATRILYRNN